MKEDKKMIMLIVTFFLINICYLITIYNFIEELFSNTFLMIITSIGLLSGMFLFGSIFMEVTRKK